VADEFWHPRCVRPPGLVRPSRIDPTGEAGPTRGSAGGPRWQKVGHGWFLPAGVSSDLVEQRILNQAVRLPLGAGLTAWAALRWNGAHYFDGLAEGGRRPRPVALLLGARNLRAGPEAQISREQIPPWELEDVGGVPCAVVERALYDETRWSSSDRLATVAVDMTVAAGLVSVDGFQAYVESRPAWTGVYRARFAADHAVTGSRSPQESRLRLVWTLDAALPTPLCNEPVFSLDGELLGFPDLFDPIAGLVGEYDGSDHLKLDRRSKDRTREERFRDHGLEYVAVVRGEMSRTSDVVQRLRSAYRRSPFSPEDERRWTLEQPAWFRSGLAG
jgi:hypothetical protein